MKTKKYLQNPYTYFEEPAKSRLKSTNLERNRRHFVQITINYTVKNKMD